MKQAILILGILFLSITFSSAMPMIMSEDPQIPIGEIIEPPVSNCGDIGAEPCPYVFKDGTWPDNGHHEKKIVSKLDLNYSLGFEGFNAVITNKENSLSNHEMLKFQCGRYFWRYDIPRLMHGQSYKISEYMAFNTNDCKITIDTEY